MQAGYDGLLRDKTQPRASHHSGRISPSVLWRSPRLIRPPRRPTGLLLWRSRTSASSVLRICPARLTVKPAAPPAVFGAKTSEPRFSALRSRDSSCGPTRVTQRALYAEAERLLRRLLTVDERNAGLFQRIFYFEVRFCSIRSSLFPLLCYPKAEPAQFVIINEFEFQPLRMLSGFRTMVET